MQENAHSLPFDDGSFVMWKASTHLNRSSACSWNHLSTIALVSARFSRATAQHRRSGLNIEDAFSKNSERRACGVAWDRIGWYL